VSFSEKDWEDIKFGVDNQVDFYAVSFVKDARVVHELKDYLKSKFNFCLLFLIPRVCFGIYMCVCVCVIFVLIFYL
jgi:pyruvate kinase